MRILTPHCLVGTLLLSLIPWSVPQDAKRQDAPLAPERQRVDRTKLREDLQGVWKLVELRTSNIRNEARQDVGMCVIQGNYLSMEVHIGWVGNDSRPDARSFQSGTHKFALNDEGQMELSTLIGAFINRAGEPQFEPPGTARKYDITVAANRLTMSRADDQVLTFDRVVDATDGKDFYGRPLRERAKSAAEKDRPAGQPEKDKKVPD